jgi:hypothetical protein
MAQTKITGDMIADDAVTTAKIADDAVTTALIADDAVTTALIADDAITTALIADDAVTADQLANSINSAITANTAKVTNAITTHTGDVTGAAALTIADNAVNIAKLAVTDGSAGQVLSTDGSGAMSFITPATIQKLSSAPSVGSEGTLYYNTTTDKLYLSNGTAWLPLDTNAPPVPTGGTVTIAAQSGLTTFSYNLGLNFTDEDVDANLIYTLESGTLPAGAVLPTSGNSALTGTVTNTAATYNFVIRATDAKAAFSTQAYTQTIIVVGGTGGTVTTYGSYKAHTFTSSGTFTMLGAGAIDVLMVAGGGGGGGSTAGGGGAGGVITATSISAPAGNISIVIGAGGLGDHSANTGNAINTSGGNTTFSLGSLTSIGGGYGARGYVTSAGTRNASAGGSGGGGGQYSGNNYNPTLPGAGTSGQGHAGGSATNTNNYGGAGGGGAGGAGGNFTGSGGVGGVGLSNNYRTGSGEFRGGGGGGATHGSNTTSNIPGGNGGGGAGGPINATAGAVNTGGGGGGKGQHQSASTQQGAGGSGIVIIRYAV